MQADFPFPLTGGSYEQKFAVNIVRPGQSLLRRSRWADEQLERKKSLRDDPDHYFAAEAGSETIQWEAVRYLERWSSGFQFPSEPTDRPLWKAGLAIQEDLVLMSAEPPFCVLAGAVFFPSGWSIVDKLGLPNQEVHRPVPGYRQHLHAKTEKLLGGLKYARPVSRDNWGIRPSDRWDQLPQFAAQWQAATARIDAQNAGDRCFFRGEYQTLSRLPDSGSILFTIHSWHVPIAELTSEQCRNLLKVLETCPENTLEYKDITPFYRPLLQWLRDRCQE